MIGVNLIPRQRVIARARRRHLGRWGGVVAGVALIGVIPLVFGLSDNARVSDLKARLAGSAAELGAVRKELVEVALRGSRARGRLEAAQALRSKRSWTSMIAMIGRVAPSEVWFTALATDPVRPSRGSVSVPRRGSTGAAEGDAPTRVVIEAPRRLVIHGYATSQQALYQFMSGLTDTGVFERVTLQNAVQEGALEGRKVDFALFRFELSCEW